MSDRISDSGYYGIPDDIDMDGLTPDGFLCATKARSRNSCKFIKKKLCVIFVIVRQIYF